MLKYLNDKRLWTIPRDRSRPIYKHIEDLVIRLIRDGVIRPRQPLPSYPWLSRTLGVADKTVRQAYSSLQQAGILVIQSGKGTFVAPRGLGAVAEGPSANGALGLIVPSRSGVSSSAYASRLVQGVQDEAAKVGLLVIAGDVGQAERLALRPPDAGLILLARPADPVWAKLRVLPLPFIWAGAQAPGDDVPRVVLDAEGAGRECAYRLIGGGHRRIGLLRSGRDPSGEALEGGWRHALGAAGLAIDPAAVQVVDRDAGETGLTSADALLTLDLTGVVVVSRALLSAFSEAAWRRGRKVPAEVSVVALLEKPGPAWVGGEAVEAGVLDPAEAGRRAVRRLREQHAGGVERLEPHWVRGQSIAAPGGAVAP